VGTQLFGGWKKPTDSVNDENQVGIVNADGSGFRLITSGANNNAFPSFAPDGKRTLSIALPVRRVMACAV